MAPDLRKRLLAIVAADVAGYSRLISIDAAATLAMLDAARAVFRERIEAHGGRVVDMAGDSVMAVFDSAAGAVAAALVVQADLAASVAQTGAELSMRFRIGIHLGDVIEKADGTVYGDGVNIAARLQTLAEPGAIAVSQAVHGLVARSLDAVFEDIGNRSLKNIAAPVRAFRARRRLPHEAAQATATADLAPWDGPGNLPASLPALYGRDGDLAALRGLVRAHRLVSIVGAGGIGKTRLALATGHASRDGFVDGVWIAELAPVADPALLAATVAQALDLKLAGRKPPRDEVIDALADRAMLLVLDNCEHLVQAAGAFVNALLERSPRLHVLATSQELLKLPEERLYRLDALAVPLASDLAAAETFGSVRLFADRVQALLPAFAVDAGNLADVVAICQGLEGSPLAIELAAARVPLLGVSGVREHLHERFRLLTRGSRVAMRRHQTLREALDWSHGLLAPAERDVFRRIAVFSGGFTLRAAQQTAGDAALDEWAVADQIGALVDKSLLLADAAEPRRYRMLESAREYALEKLAQSGEAPSVRDRHAAFFLGEVWAAEPQLTSAGRHLPLMRLRADLNNVRAAMSWLVRERADAAAALRLAASLSWLAYFEGLFQEGRAWMAEALALPGADRFPAERAAALSGAARLAAYSGDAAAGRALARESVALWREAGDRRGLAYALFHEGIACIVAGQTALARAALAESLASFRALEDPWGIALGASYLGTAFAIFAGDEDRARALMLEGRSRFRALGDEWGASVSSHYLGSIALRTGDHAQARALTEEMLVNARSLGDKYRICRNLHQLAEIDRAEGRQRSAVRRLHESMSLSRQQGRLGDAAQQLRLFARLALDLGAGDVAVRLAAVAERHAGADRTMPPDDMQSHAEVLSRLQGVLGAEPYRAAFAAGEALSLEQAAALAAGLAPQSA